MLVKQDFKTLEGVFLIANPNMLDGRFSKTVILITKYSKTQGAEGFIINKLSAFSFKDLLNSIPLDYSGRSLEKFHNILIKRGGPVSSNNLCVIHDDSFYSKSSTKVINQKLFYNKTASAINDILSTEKDLKDINIFLGSSTWVKNQLENEIKNNVWFLLEEDRGIIFNAKDDTIWKTCLNKIGILETNSSFFSFN